jgi:LysR family transcriptional activator of nhaA
MEWLNYHHLYYFWTVAKEGTISRACEKLRLAQPTISRQLAQLEENLDEQLFDRSGRTLELTETGRLVFEYADEIFPVGHELMEVLRGRPRGRPTRFLVGISDGIPKLVAFRILEPVLRMGVPVQLVCQEAGPEELLRKLSEHTLDMVLTDAPLSSAAYKTRAFNHQLGSCGATVFAAPRVARKLRRNFPHSLDGQPFLLPLPGSALRRSLDDWFDRNEVRPLIVGEFQDSALLKAFAQAGSGAFVGPSAIEAEIRNQYKVAAVGHVESIVERFYAISLERKVRHPAVLAVTEKARRELF